MDNINVFGQLSDIDHLETPFTIFPNPSKGQFTIAHSLSKPELIIYGADGRIVFNQVLQTQQSNIELNAKAGIYILHVNDGIKTYVEKVTIH
jgi:hypothetical protein